LRARLRRIAQFDLVRVLRTTPISRLQREVLKGNTSFHTVGPLRTPGAVTVANEVRFCRRVAIEKKVALLTGTIERRSGRPNRCRVICGC
jgi:hypothetical protein